jgi:hypothetical protein
VKRSLVAPLVAVLGFIGGIQFQKMRHAREDIQQLLWSDYTEQRYATVVSLGVLDTLEAAQLDKAKSLLARELAVYHHAFHEREESLPKKQRLAPEIDALAAKSTTLKEELHKPSK